jgi:tripartite-type tricarboxylate transporter receptor subunit TctC
MKLVRGPFVIAVGAALLGAGAGPASADAVADFYNKKTITVMVPSSLGATFGHYGRLVVENLGRHIPGSPNAIIESRPGAGGSVGTTYAYNVAPQDGSYVSLVMSPSVIAPLMNPRLKFDASRFNWLGSLSDLPAVLSVWAATTPARTLDEAKKVEVVVGSSGKSSQTYTMPILMNHLLGTRFKVVLGYKGGAELSMAMEQGEIMGRGSYWSGWVSGKPDWLRDKKILHLAQYGPRIRELPDVPSVVDVVQDPKGKQMVRFLEIAGDVGMGFWVGPNVPKDRVAALRKAFDSMMRDKAFLAQAAKLRVPIEAVSGEDLQQKVEEVYRTPRPVIQELEQVLGLDKG